jgi:hypothetical protein
MSPSIASNEAFRVFAQFVHSCAVRVGSKTVLAHKADVSREVVDRITKLKVGEYAEHGEFHEAIDRDAIVQVLNKVQEIANLDPQQYDHFHKGIVVATPYAQVTCNEVAVSQQEARL